MAIYNTLRRYIQLGLKVEVKNNNVEKAMRILKKKMLKDGVLRLYKMKQTFEKPSEKELEKQKKCELTI